MPEVYESGSVITQSAAPLASPRLALLTNVIPPYNKAWLDLLTRRYQHVRILLSTRMESNRAWKLEWEGLDVLVQKNITFHRNWRHPQGFQEPLFVHFPVDTFAQLNRFKADIIISWEMGLRTIVAALYRLLHRRTRLIIWAEIAESTEKGRGLLRKMIRRVLHHFADGFLVTGSSGVRYLRGVGVPSRKLHQISYSTDISRFTRVPSSRVPDASRRLLYVGQLIERKGLLPFVNMLCQWAEAHPQEELEFRLAGDGPLRSPLQSHRLPANVRLQFLGNVGYESLPEVYADAGIFVLPTLADTWAVVVNEAMAAGLPVLGSVYSQAVSELVTDENGWRFRPDIPDEMYAAIARALATDFHRLNEMRKEARQAAADLTPAKMLTAIQGAIDSCLGSRQRPQTGETV